MSAKETTKSFLAGWAGGCGNLIVGHPFDTIKASARSSTLFSLWPQVRMQDNPNYKGALDCLRQTIKHEGPLAVYKGVVAPMSGGFVVVHTSSRTTTNRSGPCICHILRII